MQWCQGRISGLKRISIEERIQPDANITVHLIIKVGALADLGGGKT